MKYLKENLVLLKCLPKIFSFTLKRRIIVDLNLKWRRFKRIKSIWDLSWVLLSTWNKWVERYSQVESKPWISVLLSSEITLNVSVTLSVTFSVYSVLILGAFFIVLFVGEPYPVKRTWPKLCIFNIFRWDAFFCIS